MEHTDSIETFSMRGSAPGSFSCKIALTVLFTLFYALSLHSSVPFLSPVFKLILILLFAFSVSWISHIVIMFLIYLTSQPLILHTREDILDNGIPANVKIAFFRPIFSKSFAEMKSLLNSMEQDINNNGKANKNLKYIVIDNTRDEKVKKETRDAIKALQKTYGEDMVFYFHRNVKCDFFKKVGILLDSIMFLYEGWTKPELYTDQKWEKWAKGTRDQNEPMFDVILGDISSLGIKGSVADITSGKNVEVDKSERIELCFVSDADNVWPEGEVRKMVGKMLHPANRQISIFQPTIRVSNPDENKYINLTVLAREFEKFEPVGRWRLHRFSPFYGKGAMKLDNYIQDIALGEALHPGKAASHDFQEALKTPTVLTEDVYINEKTFSNKLSELKRNAQWLWGDMETVRQYILKNFESGRKAHLYILFRGIFGDLFFGAWLTLSFLLWWIGLVKPINVPFWFVTVGLAILYLGLPYFLSPFLIAEKDAEENILPNVLPEVSTVKKIWRSIHFCVQWFFIQQLDLIYKPKAAVINFLNQINEKPFVWKTGAMGEIETANMGLLDYYKSLWIPPVVGAVLVIMGLIGLIPFGLFMFSLPFALSFLLGPGLIYMTKAK
ncbi:MAG: hypothetical protein P9M03_09005 [Candidatus Theseobacter exili]|nr:hypothetical protein [Candidatus Theseobacter exili]